MNGKEAIKMLRTIKGTVYLGNRKFYEAIDAAIKTLEQPTIEPRKTGKWIPVTNGRGGFECDQCHNYAPSYQDGVEWLSGFCPNCGAEMLTEDKE